MNDHVLKRLHTGNGMTGKITPTCSCGWVGIGYEAHNDYQHWNVAVEEERHFQKVREDNPQQENDCD